MSLTNKQAILEIDKLFNNKTTDLTNKSTISKINAQLQLENSNEYQAILNKLSELKVKPRPSKAELTALVDSIENLFEKSQIIYTRDFNDVAPLLLNKAKNVLQYSDTATEILAIDNSLPLRENLLRATNNLDYVLNNNSNQISEHYLNLQAMLDSAILNDDFKIDLKSEYLARTSIKRKDFTRKITLGVGIGILFGSARFADMPVDNASIDGLLNFISQNSLPYFLGAIGADASIASIYTTIKNSSARKLAGKSTINEIFKKLDNPNLDNKQIAQICQEYKITLKQAKQIIKINNTFRKLAVENIIHELYPPTKKIDKNIKKDEKKREKDLRLDTTSIKSLLNELSKENPLYLYINDLNNKLNSEINHNEFNDTVNFKEVKESKIKVKNTKIKNIKTKNTEPKKISNVDKGIISQATKIVTAPIKGAGKVSKTAITSVKNTINNIKNSINENKKNCDEELRKSLIVIDALENNKGKINDKLRYKGKDYKLEINAKIKMAKEEISALKETILIKIMDKSKTKFNIDNEKYTLQIDILNKNRNSIDKKVKQSQ